MISVGLWGAFLGRPLIYALPVVFPVMMVMGAIMGMFVVPLPSVELGIALSVLMLGGCIALPVRAPVWSACVIVAIFAVFHGYAHGKELPSAADHAWRTGGGQIIISHAARHVITGLTSPRLSGMIGRKAEAQAREDRLEVRFL
jgi:hydrogenase/urease accessory protein HupE